MMEFILKKSSLISYVDSAFAKRVGMTSDESTQTFLAALMAFSRCGHLCMSVEDGKLFPSLLNEELDALVCEGSKNLKEKYFDTFLERYENSYYLKKNWVYETSIVDDLKRLEKGEVQSLEYSSRANLNDKQRDAFGKVLRSPLTIITGGPGTGKTYVAEQIIREFSDRNKSVLVGAPTGKAATNLKRIAEGVTVGTLHSLFGIKPSVDFHDKQDLLFADLIIIDECSMIDVAMWAKLLSSILTGTRLILLGDQNQLPPVDAGTVFHEICDWTSSVHLTECLRCDQKEILHLASEINLSHTENVMKLLRPKLLSDFVIKDVKAYFSPEYTDDYGVLFDRFRAFRILSCLRKGPQGVDAINHKIYYSLKRCDPFVVPILITKTSYRAGLYNGESGILVQHLSDSHKNYAVFFDNNKKFRILSEALLPPYEYGYCLSVHKSQGGEYENILLMVPPGSERFGREILYTAVTRAKSSVSIIGTEEVIQCIVQTSSQKRSHLGDRLSAS